MQVYKNVNASYDVVNSDNYLFHLNNGNCKIIGKVGEHWKPSGAQINIFPREYKCFKILIDIYKTNRDK